MYRARPDGLAELREFLQEFWGSRLKLLAQAAEAEEKVDADGDTRRQ